VKWVKLGISNLILGLVEASSSKCMIDYPPQVVCSGFCDLFKFWQINDNISKTVEDTEIVITED